MKMPDTCGKVRCTFHFWRWHPSIAVPLGRVSHVGGRWTFVASMTWRAQILVTLINAAAFLHIRSTVEVP